MRSEPARRSAAPSGIATSGASCTGTCVNREGVERLFNHEFPPISTLMTPSACLDDAIAGAVTEYGRDRDEPIHGEVVSDNQIYEDLARELGKSISTAIVALEAITTGRVGIAGSTGTLLRHSLSGAQHHVNQLLAAFSAARPN
jgi:hypothetical protein